MASRAGCKSEYLKTSINDSDLVWKKESNKKFKYHMTVTHKPSGISIEQASERAWSECVLLCKNSLKWKLSLK